MTSEEPVKIVFWDLDGTLWRGTLEEDSEQATLPVEVLHNTLLELDRRGILNSIVSQASQAAAVAKLNQLNLLDLFIHPVFDASSKAQAVAVALQQLNLLPVNAAFVDDQPFHRAEVTALLPGVLTLPPEELPGLLHTSRFSSVSTLGSQRRQMYKAEEQREDAQRSFGGNRAEFLKACKMVLTCRIATQDDQQRLAELFVRTHRLSSSPAQASRAIASSAHSIYAASLCDRFGDYGLVGGAVLYTGATAKLDPVTNHASSVDPVGAVGAVGLVTCEQLAISCRVQGRGVLEAFLAWLNKLDAVRDRTFVIPISTVSDVNQPLRMALRFCGFAPTSKSAEQELLTLVRPERLAAPEWMHVEGALE